MSSSGDGKPAQTGLVDMGTISFYNLPQNVPANLPSFTIADLDHYPGSFNEMVLNVTWGQLQATEGGPLTTTVIDSAISEVNAYNLAHGADLGIKLRVWGGFTAPDWAKSIDGAPITVTGRATVDPGVYDPQTIGRFWTADYIDAWTSLQSTLAGLYDSNPVIRGISNTAGTAASDEPFVPLMTAAPTTSAPGSPTVNQVAQLQAGGYNDAAQMLTLRASIADYAQWSTTPLDFTMNNFYVFDGAHETDNPNFSLAVLQQARNSTRMVQAGNHALRDPLYAPDAAVYGQLAADAALNPAVASNSFQTAAPIILDASSTGWQDAVASGVALNAGNIELWNYPTAAGVPNGFLSLSTAEVRELADTLAAGTAPSTGAPTDGAALGFVAPALATGAPGAVAFSGTDAVLLASAAPQAAYRVTLTSLGGGTLGVVDFGGTVMGATSGPSLTLSGSLDKVNTVLAHLTDTLPAGTDVIHIVATDSGGHSAVRDVGVQTAPSGASSPVTPGLLPADQLFALGGSSARVVGQGQAGILDIATELGSSGILVVGGVQSALSVAGNLTVDNNTTLLAALSSSAYSTASLTVGGALEVESGGSAYFSGMLGAAAVVNSGGTIRGNGTLAVAGSGAITNNGTIEAVADLARGAQRLVITNDIAATAGSGTLIIDPGATLVLDGQVQSQSIQFMANSDRQFANDPYSPSTLVLEDPTEVTGSTISGFTFADRLVLENITIVGTPTWSAGTLTVNQAVGPALTFALSGDNLASYDVNVSVAGPQNIISFVAPTGGMAPSVVVQDHLRVATGVEVLVPDIVLQAPLPTGPLSAAELTFTVTVATTAITDKGLLRINGLPAVGGTSVSVSGTMAEIERSLQTLTYQTQGASADSIQVIIQDSASRSGQATITVDNTPVSGAFEWHPAGSNNDFFDPANWNIGATAPGGGNAALFAAGTHTAVGDGAVGQIFDFGTTTLTGNVTAQGLGDLAVVVDGGGALTLAGGALLAAQQQAIVGRTGEGLLTLMGGALALTGTSTPDALVIGETAGSTGTVLNLNQITAAGTVVVGAGGTGTLELLGVAASVSDRGADIGQSAGAQGSVIVNGGEWMTSGQLTVGDAGAGSLLINGMANGTTGQATAYNAVIGAQAGGRGSVMLDGGALQVANVMAPTSTLVVGGGGTGDLAIENGSEVAVGAAQGTVANNNGRLLVGAAAGGRGQVLVGGNSALMVYGSAAIGGAGVGEVIVGRNADDKALFALIGTLAIGGTGQLALSGANATVRGSAIDIASGGVVSGAGTISGLGGGNGTVMLASIANGGAIEADGGNLLLYGGVTGTGSLSVGTGATMTLQSAVGSGQTLAFGTNSRAVLNDARAFSGTIAGFDSDDVLDIAGMTATGATWSDGILTLDTVFGALQLRIAGAYASNDFTLQADGHGGTYVLAGGHGDVHMITFDGQYYDFQAVGDFIAVRSTDPGNAWQIQIRTASFPGATSITTGLAATLGDDRVTFAVGRANPVYVDGAPDTALHIGVVQNLARGTLTQLSAAAYQLAWNTGESVIVTYQDGYMDWSVGLGPQDGPGSVQGLLGSHSGRVNDFQLPDGTVIAQPSDDQLLGIFADAWRVAPGRSILDDSAPAASAPASSSALLLQFMAAMGGDVGATAHVPNAMLQDTMSRPADHLLAAAPSSPFHG